MQIQQSRRNVTKFVPDICKWVIIIHKKYDRVHNHFKKGWRDIPQVENDKINVLKGIKGLGARQEDIDVLEDQKVNALIKYFNQVRSNAITAWNVERKRTLIFIYYAGHGLMDSYTYAVTNETPENG